jgi:hypothetical protein
VQGMVVEEDLGMQPVVEMVEVGVYQDFGREL